MIFLAPLIAVAQMAAPAPSTADAAFTRIWQAEWAWRTAERLADDDPRAVSPHLPDVSAAAHARRAAKWRGVMAQLDRLDATALSPEQRTNYQVYRAQIAALLDDERFREWEKPLNGDSAFWGDLQFAARGNFANGEKDYRAYLSQLADIPRYLDQQTANMRAGLARGFTPPAVVMQGRDAPVAAIAEAANPEATVYYEPFAKIPASVPDRAALQAAARKVIADGVIPAHRQLLAFLRTTYFPGMRQELGASSYPDGAAYYRSRIRAFTTLDLSPDQVHAIGLAEVAKIRAEMERAKADAGFTGDLPAFLTFLRTDPRFYAKTPEALLQEAAWEAKRFDGMAAKWFGRLPRARFAIKPVPAAIAPFYTAGRGGPGGYLVNTYDLPSRPLFQLPPLTLHESAPGHAMQISLASENKDLPVFRRQSYISAYGEGWALYCERLGDEMGFYQTPYERFGMLSYQMWRAVRLVVDTGVHAKGWTRPQALAFLRNNTALSEREVTTEVDRYIGWPGQALSYYLGQLAIQRARAKAEKALGPKFDIRAFHDTVLSLGSVPLPVLDARIDRFVAEGGPSPYQEED
ncbi:DUF885 domain-containing protein [Sphingomonas rubra]|uniref:Uncharacterized conserved protein, DUF885 familyt n=1 Tax=Sphingomonas rubra TaxID=634430 RepID=A0A1I5UDR9_9SPHN|nr:DUF885 family protein [Sphingomonas rubra]SFP93405.1 Uncharacterized conserved protein, DUF885 familyt [Sphingomonas rubra]